MKKGDRVLYGLYDDEQDLLRAVKSANEKKLRIMDVFTPFPVHGLDDLLDLSESRLHIVGFWFGLLGAITAFGGMSWIFVFDWPLVYGGKPHWPVLSFIPITFELTVLFSSIGMFFTFLLINGMAPFVSNPVLDRRTTDDKFCIAFDITEESDTEDELSGFLEETGAAEINTKQID